MLMRFVVLIRGIGKKEECCNEADLALAYSSYKTDRHRQGCETSNIALNPCIMAFINATLLNLSYTVNKALSVPFNEWSANCQHF